MKTVFTIAVTVLVVAPIAAFIGYRSKSANTIAIESSIAASTVVNSEDLTLPTSFRAVTEAGVSGLEVVLPQDQSHYIFGIQYDCSVEDSTRQGPILFEHIDGVLQVNDDLMVAASERWSLSFERIDNDSYYIYLHYKHPDAERLTSTRSLVRVVFE